MVIKILGTGCPNCVRLKRAVVQVLEEVGVRAEVLEVKDVPGIMSYGIMSTPGLVINERVRSYGRIPGHDELARLIRAAMVES
ncbi:MAG: thioredoxin family protein [Symbiobacteriia bacterium]